MGLVLARMVEHVAPEREPQHERREEQGQRRGTRGTRRGTATLHQSRRPTVSVTQLRSCDVGDDSAELSTPRVFVILAVFNRRNTTLACIERLKQQTYPNIEIVVSDGGSTDAPSRSCDCHPEVTLIADVGEQWWTGSTWFGIEHALCGTVDDYVLLLNDDTGFPPDLVEVLVDEAARHGAAVEASRSTNAITPACSAQARSSIGIDIDPSRSVRPSLRIGRTTGRTCSTDEQR